MKQFIRKGGNKEKPEREPNFQIKRIFEFDWRNRESKEEEEIQCREDDC